MAAKGDRIELLSMPEDPCPLPAGATGTILHVNEVRGPECWTQYMVKWDAPHEKRTLMVITPPDQFKVLPCK